MKAGRQEKPARTGNCGRRWSPGPGTLLGEAGVPEPAAWPLCLLCSLQGSEEGLTCLFSSWGLLAASFQSLHGPSSVLIAHYRVITWPYP